MAIFLVKVTPAEPTTKLIDAKTRAQAVMHVAKQSIAVTVPTRGELVMLGAQGVKVETAETV
jgi:hypothetical protein